MRLPIILKCRSFSPLSDSLFSSLFFRLISTGALSDENRSVSRNYKRSGNTKRVGKVVAFYQCKGYGFIEPKDGGPDLFVHYSDVVGSKVYVPRYRHKKLQWKSQSFFPMKQIGGTETRLPASTGCDRNFDEHSHAAWLKSGEKVTYEVSWDGPSRAARAILVKPILDGVSKNC